MKRTLSLFSDNSPSTSLINLSFKRILMLATLLTFTLTVSASNLRLDGKPRITSVSDGVATIELTLQWDNAWRFDNNWDAVWLFFKYKTSDDNAWQHVNLDTDVCSFSEPGGGRDYTYSFGKTGGKAVGVFVYLAEDAFCDPIVKCKLQWTLPAGVTKADFDNNSAFLLTQGIEMVYIPYGFYQLGQTDKPFAFNSAVVNSEDKQDFLVNSATSPSAPTDVPLSADYPKGYRGFHAMKYETSQEQYVTFLNTLTLAQQSALVPNLSTFKVGDYIFGSTAQGLRPNNRNGIVVAQKVAGRPVYFATNLTNDKKYSQSNDGRSIPCNYISVDAMQAYCSWSGLRPMSELEFEKSCRHPDIPTPPKDEYIWGDTKAPSYASGLKNANTSSELPSSRGQVNANNKYDGPLRSGGIAAAAVAAGQQTQQATGATYWGLMDIGGNLREICAGASNSSIAYSDHGDGSASVKWGTNASDFGYRGGSFASTAPASLQTSDRSDMSASVTAMNAPCKESSFRGVRTFDAETYVDSIHPGSIGIGGQLICPDGDITINNTTSATIKDMTNIHFDYSWSVDGTPQVGESSSNFVLKSLIASHTYTIQRTAKCILGTVSTTTLVKVPAAVSFALDKPIVWTGDTPIVTASSTASPSQNLSYLWTYNGKELDSEVGQPPLVSVSYYSPIASDLQSGVSFSKEVICTASYVGCSSGSVSKALTVHTHVLDAGGIAIDNVSLNPSGHLVIKSSNDATVSDQSNVDLTYSWYVGNSNTPQSPNTNTSGITLALAELTNNQSYTIHRRVKFKHGISYRSSSVTASVSSAPTTPTVNPIETAKAYFTSSVVSDGGSHITTRGFVYSSTNTTPSLSDTKVAEGSGLNAFARWSDALASNDNLWVRSFATNAVGTSYSTSKNFTTKAVVTTNPVTIYSTSSATMGGSIAQGGNSNISERGIQYSLYSDMRSATTKPNGKGVGSFSAGISPLVANEVYYVRAYAVNTGGTSYGSVTSFSTNPTISTSGASSIAGVSATLGGSVALGGGASIKEHGLVIKINGTPTTSDRKILIRAIAPSGTFSGSVDGLVRGSVYKVRAYAIKSDNVVVYGNEISFTTVNYLTITTSAAIAANITTSSAILGGNITGVGGSVGAISSRGIYLKTSAASTWNLHANGSGSGGFSKSHIGLSSNTNYNFKATAENQAGRREGSVLNFTTKAVVTTTPVTVFSGTSASMGGSVAQGGNANISVRGVQYSLYSDMRSATTKPIGSGVGSFSASIGSLAFNTRYYVRAYATNAGGTSYGSVTNFWTGYLPSVTTSIHSNLSVSSVRLNATLNDAGRLSTERGFQYGTSSSLSGGIAVSTSLSTGNYYKDLTGLRTKTKYYFRAYAKNSAGGTVYGSTLNFITTGTPELTTLAASSVSVTTARLNGNISNAGGLSNTRCFRYSLNSNMSSSVSKCASSSSSTGTYYVDVTGLLSKRTYYFEAYADNSAGGPVYGSKLSFTTTGTPTVSTSAASSVSVTTARLNGNLTSVGGLSTDRGFQYGTSSSLSGGTIVSTNTSTGTYLLNLTGLRTKTRYYYRAYAKNSAGATVYGSTLSFITTGTPDVSTSSASYVSVSTARLNGNVSNVWGLSTKRGFQYSKVSNLSSGTTTKEVSNTASAGSYYLNISSLSPRTYYYYRAYASNSAGGTIYGSILNFRSQGVPVVVTNNVTGVSKSGATFSGNINDVGGLSTRRGFHYTTNSNLSGGTHVDHSTSSSTGTFTKYIGLSSGTTYYVRAYGVNSHGTIYGAAKSFRTPGIPSTPSTPTVSDISINSAKFASSVSSNNGASITSVWFEVAGKGVKQGTPTPANGGSFSLIWTGLDAKTSYQVRSYAINGIGTSGKSGWKSFETASDQDVEVGNYNWLVYNLGAKPFAPGSGISVGSYKWAPSNLGASSFDTDASISVGSYKWAPSNLGAD